MKRVASLSLVAFLVGCAAPVQVVPVRRIPFPEAEYLALPKTGTSTVKGQAFLKTRGGDVKTAAGSQVFLNPLTSYSIQWYESSYLPNRPIENYDPRLDAYMRIQQADGSGRFAFKNVPAGEYFVTTAVTWEAPTGYQAAMQKQGGVITKRIKVNAGEELDVIITR